MDEQRFSVDFLICLMSFEKYYAYNFLSNGYLYRKEIVSLSQELQKYIEQLINKRDTFESEMYDDQPKDAFFVKQLPEFSGWLSSVQKSSDNIQRNYVKYYFTAFTNLITLLRNKAGGSILPPMNWTSEEFTYHAQNLLWGGHLPKEAVFNQPADLLPQMAECPTIAFVVDIRNSQELMESSPSSDYFMEQISYFLDRARFLLEDCGGIFDKFTGDGLIGYFNEQISALCQKEMKKSYLDFVKELHGFATSHFNQWQSKLKSPLISKTGIAIGSDIGSVDFFLLQNHFVCVGLPIVQAQRLSSSHCAKAGETLVSNELVKELSQSFPLTLASRQCTVKDRQVEASVLISLNSP